MVSYFRNLFTQWFFTNISPSWWRKNSL